MKNLKLMAIGFCVLVLPACNFSSLSFESSAPVNQVQTVASVQYTEIGERLVSNKSGPRLPNTSLKIRKIRTSLIR